MHAASQPLVPSGATRISLMSVRPHGISPAPLLVGSPEAIAAKIVYMNEVPGGISRISIQLTPATLAHAKVMNAIELLGTRVTPTVRKEVAVKQAAVSAVIEWAVRDHCSRHRRANNSSQFISQCFKRRPPYDLN
jgi:hypothetical protein